jgi:hypothetical protein
MNLRSKIDTFRARLYAVFLSHVQLPYYITRSQILLTLLPVVTTVLDIISTILR